MRVACPDSAAVKKPTAAAAAAAAAAVHFTRKPCDRSDSMSARACPGSAAVKKSSSSSCCCCCWAPQAYFTRRPCLLHPQAM
jgi:hypothetical protein